MARIALLADRGRPTMRRLVRRRAPVPDAPAPCGSHGGPAAERGAPPRRRLDDLNALVRRWVDEGAVDPRVAARFIRERMEEAHRRRTTWSLNGYASRRRDG